MEKLNIIVYAALICATFASVVFGYHAEISSRVVDGSILAPENGFAYQASLRNSTGHHKCGAVIIDKDWLLTSCQCIRGISPSQLSVIVGTKDINSGGITHLLSSVKCHEDYNSLMGLYRNDIALLKVFGSLTLTHTVKTIPLETGPTNANVNALVSGWGAASANGANSLKLQYANVKTITELSCQKRLGFPDGVMYNHICTANAYGAEECTGDGGGPVVAVGYLVGLGSYGRPCAKGYPDIHTKIAPYVRWIYQNMI